LDPS
jgi:hypothetical protein